MQVFVILDEYFLAGEVMETSKTQVLTRPSHVPNLFCIIGKARPVHLVVQHSRRR